MWAAEEEIIQYVVGTLQPKLSVSLRPLPKTLEQLIQKGMEVQDGLERAASPPAPTRPLRKRPRPSPALTNESVASDRTQPEWGCQAPPARRGPRPARTLEWARPCREPLVQPEHSTLSLLA